MEILEIISMMRMMIGMNNRQRYILNANEYDFLIRIQHYMERCMPIFKGCIIDAITGKIYYCPTTNPDMEDCKECIQNWLNEDERKGEYK